MEISQQHMQTLRLIIIATARLQLKSFYVLTEPY